MSPISDSEVSELKLEMRELKRELHSVNEQLGNFLEMFNGEDNEDIGIRGMVLVMWQERKATKDKVDRAQIAAFGSVVTLFLKIVYDMVIAKG